MYTVREWATAYRERGFAICRIKAGEKRPTYGEWNRYSLEPYQFTDTDNIGIQPGPLSGNLVCLDVDSRIALGHADRLLPPTGMLEGRPGKPRSHRWYKVTNIPPELTAGPKVAGGLGGPFIKPFNAPDGSRILDFLGTGSQAVVPPSVWVSVDRARRERREWDSFGEPRVIDARELFEGACRLASTCGWAPKQPRPTKERQRPSGEKEILLLPIPPGENVQQARAYLAGVPPAIQGEGGDMHTYCVAALLVVDFGLSVEEALPVLLEWNARCEPPWTDGELIHKLEAACSLEGTRGWRVGRRLPIAVSVRADAPVVFVGVDCAGERSYVSMETMGAGVRKVGRTRELAPALAAVDWKGKHVLLAPPSTITTNKRECWAEYHLARLLLQHGAATVEALRLPPLNGRRRTLAMVGSVALEVVPPPANAGQACARADEAGQRARELDPIRKSLPRKRASPKVAAAEVFLRKHNVTRLTKDVLQHAKSEGISRDSLRRAMKRKK
jgi:hypothetical protein